MPMRRLPTEPLVPLFASCRVLRHALPRNTLHRSARAPHRNAAPIPAHHAFTLCRVTSYRPISESAADPHVCSPQPLAAHADSPRVGPSHAKPPRGNHHELHSCRHRARARVAPLRALALPRGATAPLCTLHSSAAIRRSARTRYRSARTSAGSCPPCLTVPDYQRPRPPPVVSGRPLKRPHRGMVQIPCPWYPTSLLPAPNRGARPWAEHAVRRTDATSTRHRPPSRSPAWRFGW